jgi:hypothetical protein
MLAAMLKFALALGAAMVLVAPSAIGSDPTALGVGFICGAEKPDAPVGPPGTIIPGVGAEVFPVDTANPDAQAWFNQGIRLYHAFYHEPAKAAFAKAAGLDPTCALCAWGVALSVGPNLNNAISQTETVAALALADRAAALVKPGDERAKGLIAALQLRYGTTAPKEGREQAYGHAMDALYKRYPNDNEIGNLAAHALLTPARYEDFSGVARGEEILETGAGPQPRTMRRRSTTTSTPPSSPATRPRRSPTPTSWPASRPTPATWCTWPRTPSCTSAATRRWRWSTPRRCRSTPTSSGGRGARGAERRALLPAQLPVRPGRAR